MRKLCVPSTILLRSSGILSNFGWWFYLQLPFSTPHSPEWNVSLVLNSTHYSRRLFRLREEADLQGGYICFTILTRRKTKQRMMSFFPQRMFCWFIYTCFLPHGFISLLAVSLYNFYAQLLLIMYAIKLLLFAFAIKNKSTRSSLLTENCHGIGQEIGGWNRKFIDLICFQFR